MKKDVIVEKTSKYISIQSYLIGRVSMTNINKSPVFRYNYQSKEIR